MWSKGRLQPLPSLTLGMQLSFQFQNYWERVAPPVGEGPSSPISRPYVLPLAFGLGGPQCWRNPVFDEASAFPSQASSPTQGTNLPGGVAGASLPFSFQKLTLFLLWGWGRLIPTNQSVPGFDLNFLNVHRFKNKLLASICT